MRRIFPLVVLVATLPLGAAMTAASASQDRPSVSLIHGLPGFTADIYLDDELLLDGFRPTEATDPMKLNAGTYDVDIRELGAPADSEPVLSDSLTLRQGEHISVVAGLDPDGDPTLTAFPNDFKDVDAGDARLVVRAVADAGPITAFVDGSKIGAAADQGDDVHEVLPASAHTLLIESRGERLAPSSNLRLQEGTATVVYVIGSADDGSIELMTEIVGGLSSPPSGVLTGTGGLADQRHANLLAAALTLVVASVIARRVVVRR